MLTGLKAGDFGLQPWDYGFADETSELVVAGIVVLTGFLAAMADECEGGGWESAALDEGLEHGYDLHFAPIEFAIEKEAEALRLAGGTAQESDGAGVTPDGVGDGVFFEFGGFWFGIGSRWR